MRTLQEIREEYARSCYYNDWEEMYEKDGISDLNLDEIVEIYSNERVNEILEEISDKIKELEWEDHMYKCAVEDHQEIILSYKIKHQ